MDFGFGSSTGSVFVLKLDKTGTPLWAKTFAVSGSLPNNFEYGAMALDPTGGVVVAGRARGSLNVGGGAFESTGFGVVVFKLDEHGAHVWSRRTTGGTSASPMGVAVDKSGNATVVGDFAGPMDFGLGALPYAMETSPGYTDAFVARLDATGKPVWNRSYGLGGNQIVHVAIDPGGDIVIFGAASGFIDFGGGALGGPTSHYSFLARLDSTGKHVFSRSIAAAAHPGQVAIDPTGEIVVAGSGFADIALGGPVLKGFGGRDGWVARYDSKGNHLAGRNFGGSGDDYALGITIASDGSLIVTGVMADTATFGGTTIVGAGASDALLLRLKRDGEVISANRFGDRYMQSAHRAALAADGANFYVAGTFTGEIDLGAGVLAAKKSVSALAELFIAKCPL